VVSANYGIFGASRIEGRCLATRGRIRLLAHHDGIQRMNRYRVAVYRIDNINGWIEVEAVDADDAYHMVKQMDTWEVEEGAEWGSCGDSTEIHVDQMYLIEDITPPSASDGLWV
jgi:alanyl-tRNA synthetase